MKMNEHPVNGDSVKFVRLTKEQFEAIDQKDPNTIYFVAPIESEEDSIVNNNDN